MEKKITIQELLINRGLNVNEKIKLVRHKDNRDIKIIRGSNYNKSLYEIYLEDRELFLEYQAEQKDDKFKDTNFVVSFLGEEGTLSRFLGVYKIEKTITDDKYSPFYYKMTELNGFENLKNRVIVDWGKGTLSWCQNFSNEKEIVRISGGFKSEFPGYPNVVLRFSELKDIFLNEYYIWKQMLSAINCIYSILDNKTGKIYIGSTYNKLGVWGRWSVYISTNGHGNNVALISLIENDPNYADNFTFSILQELPLNILPDKAINVESIYKKKLGAITFGLCEN